MVTYTNTHPIPATKMYAASARPFGVEQLNRAAGSLALAERCVR